MATRYAAVSQDEPQTKKKQTKSGDQQQRVEKEEVMQGGGKLSMSAIAESVDRLLDESHRYKSAVQAAFVRFQLPPPSPASPPHLPIDSLLSALQYFIEVSIPLQQHFPLACFVLHRRKAASLMIPSVLLQWFFCWQHWLGLEEKISLCKCFGWLLWCCSYFSRIGLCFPCMGSFVLCSPRDQQRQSFHIVFLGITLALDLLLSSKGVAPTHLPSV